VRAPLTISSIGSIPKPIPGIPMRGELFAVEDPDTGKLEAFETVFALGNAVTGKGNIRDSELHARKVSLYVINEFLKWSEEDFKIVTETGELPPEKKALSVEQIQNLLNRVQEYQTRAGYDGDYQKWVARHKKKRLEELLGKSE